MRCVRCHAEIPESYKACPHCGEPVTDFLRRYSAQPIDGKYEIVERLGAGGMGEVFKVRHTYLGALRVIKVIRPQIAESQDANDRFLREAQLATKVHHHNVATLHDFSALPDGSHYMVWEYIEGENLAQRIRASGPLPPRVAIRIAIDALHGLEAIHRAGIVHRDISPENLMLSEGSVKIIDLGVAKAEEIDGGTKTGIFVGKLRYASPEQLGFLADGEKIDGRADLYSLAIVLYEMLTGRPPFEAKSPHEYVLMHSREKAPQPIEISPALPGGVELQRILRRALETDRSQRFASAAEFAAALEDVARTLPAADPTTTTVAIALDTDETARVRDTLHQSTTREAIAAPTIRTPLPSGTASADAQTVRSAVPGSTPTPPTATAPAAGLRPERQGRSLVPLAIAAVLIVIIIAATVVFLVQRRTKEAAAPATTAQSPATATTTAQPAQTTVEVVPPASTATATTATTATTSTTPPPSRTETMATATTRAAAPESQPPVASSKKVAPTPPPPREQPAEVRAAPAAKYVDGRGNGDANDAALAHLREQLAGVTHVSVTGSNPDLVKELAKILAGRVSVADDAEVKIEFNGTLDHLGRGRKRRAATAIVSKNGRPVFAYELPAEEYRVGDDPAEAFARVLRDALP